MPALNLNRVLADLNRGSNSLNSISAKLQAQTIPWFFRIPPSKVEATKGFMSYDQTYKQTNIDSDFTYI